MCFKWELLIEPKSGVRHLASCLARACGALLIPEIMGRMGTSSLCVLGRPYIIGIFGLFDMVRAQTCPFSMCLADLLKCCVALSII